MNIKNTMLETEIEILGVKKVVDSNAIQNLILENDFIILGIKNAIGSVALSKDDFLKVTTKKIFFIRNNKKESVLLKDIENIEY